MRQPLDNVGAIHESPYTPLHIYFISIAPNVEEWVRRQGEEILMQEELEMFIKQSVSSLSKLHFLLYFYRNRNLLNTVPGIT